MNTENKSSTKPADRHLFWHVDLWRTMIVTFICAGIGGFLLVIWHLSRMDKGSEFLMPMIGALFLILLQLLIIWLINLIRNQRVVYRIVFVLLLMIVVFSALNFAQTPSAVIFGNSVASIAVSFLIFYRIPMALLGVSFLVMVGCYFFQVLPTHLLFALFYTVSGSSFFGPVIPIYGVLILGGILCAFAYLPREMEWRRYFSPYRNGMKYRKPKNGNEAYTLIELLIAIALIGVLTGGVFRAWGSVIHSHRDTQVRAHATEILTSEMNAVMALKDFPDLSSHKELPISLNEFTTPYEFQGDYSVEAAEPEGIVKITVRLIEIMEGNNQRHYRLISYRRQHE